MGSIERFDQLRQKIRFFAVAVMGEVDERREQRNLLAIAVAALGHGASGGVLRLKRGGGNQFALMDAFGQKTFFGQA
ncbi:MAG: hypothetical protein HYY23_18170 [Verrucomicrobia bacterium]|nr:hypothetical protein [Verrucomicrobiota bacterium]